MRQIHTRRHGSSTGPKSPPYFRPCKTSLVQTTLPSWMFPPHYNLQGFQCRPIFIAMPKKFCTSCQGMQPGRNPEARSPEAAASWPQGYIMQYLLYTPKSATSPPTGSQPDRKLRPGLLDREKPMTFAGQKTLLFYWTPKQYLYQALAYMYRSHQPTHHETYPNPACK